MAATRVAGAYVSGAGDTTVYTGSGRMDAILISNANAAAQTITVKDGSTTIATFDLYVSNSPIYIKFGEDKLDGIPFTTSLVVIPGSYAKVNVWYYGY